MGLIRNAVEQGRQAVDSIADVRPQRVAGMLDLVIVGAGPAGISAALAAKEHGSRFRDASSRTRSAGPSPTIRAASW